MSKFVDAEGAEVAPIYKQSNRVFAANKLILRDFVYGAVDDVQYLAYDDSTDQLPLARKEQSDWAPLLLLST
jgi:hypothetical protein